MSTELQHTELNGIADYSQALDTLCSQATRNLCLFDRNFEDAGLNSETRYETLRTLLLASSAHTLMILAHDTAYLSQRCPRITMLLRQFAHNMHIRRTPQHLQHTSEPFAVADEIHYVRRFHFNDMRGVFAQNDPDGARMLHAQFMEMWAASQPAVSATTLGL